MDGRSFSRSLATKSTCDDALLLSMAAQIRVSDTLPHPKCPRIPVVVRVPVRLYMACCIRASGEETVILESRLFQYCESSADTVEAAFLDVCAVKDRRHLYVSIQDSGHGPTS